ncbi:MAG: riboflavin kinase [Candidatus Magasanikbacteria bacterium]
MFGGKVVHGDGLGKQYGYPTANIDCKKQHVVWGSGVYAGFAFVDRTRYKAAVAIREQPWKVEVYLIDYIGEDLYDKHIDVDLKQKVSELERFDNTGELIEKIKRDVEMIKEMLNLT